MKKFSLGIVVRVAIIILLCLAFAFLYLKNLFLFAFLVFVAIMIAGVQLFKYVTSLNRKMKRLFEAIQYQDFAITFKADNTLGESFKDLNTDLNAVIGSFNQVRAEREASLHFINAIVQQINVGILSFDTEGKIEIHNQAAAKLLKVYRLKHLNDIEQVNPEAFVCITTLKSSESKLLTFSENDLSFTATDIQMRGRKIRLVAIHNIRSELQIKELEAWQNLTKVLRHEIMNSVTPIVSLSETMSDIVDYDLKTSESNEESIQDLKEALKTIQRRGKGIMNFVNAYREFTTIPLPNKSVVEVQDLFRNIEAVFVQSAAEKSIKLIFDIPNNFELFVDPDQIEQVLINIVKNGMEVDFGNSSPEITVKAIIKNGLKTIEIPDNGPGITKEEQEKIFIPFYTTKKTGSGIGLSLSRQILSLNDAKINYAENLPHGSVFILQFG